jgi:hypothetical protein
MRRWWWRDSRVFFDADERLKALLAAGDPLVRLAEVVDFEQFRGELEVALARSERLKGGRPAYDAVLMLTRPLTGTRCWCCRRSTRCLTTRLSIS